MGDVDEKVGIEDRDRWDGKEIRRKMGCRG